VFDALDDIKRYMRQTGNRRHDLRWEQVNRFMSRVNPGSSVEARADIVKRTDAWRPRVSIGNDRIWPALDGIALLVELLRLWFRCHSKERTTRMDSAEFHAAVCVVSGPVHAVGFELNDLTDAGLSRRQTDSSTKGHQLWWV